MIPKMFFSKISQASKNLSEYKTEVGEDSGPTLLNDPKFFEKSTLEIENSSEFKKCRDEYSEIIHEIDDFYKSNAHSSHPPKGEAAIKTVNTELKKFLRKFNNLSDQHFGDDLHIICGTVKETLHSVVELLSHEKIAMQTRLDAIDEMAKDLDVCVGGITSKIEETHRRLSAECADIRGTVKKIKISYLQSTILESLNKNKKAREGVEVHLVNGIYNHIAPDVGLEQKIDNQIFLVRKLLTPKFLDEEKEKALQNFNPVNVSKAIADQFLDQVKAVRETDRHTPINQDEIKNVVDSIQNVQAAQLDEKFGRVSFDKFLIKDLENNTWEFTNQKTILSQHFVDQLIKEKIAEPQDPIKININNNQESICILEDLLWKEELGSKEELTAKELVSIPIENLISELKSIGEQNGSIDEVYSTIINHVIKFHTPDLDTAAVDRWLNSIVLDLAESPQKESLHYAAELAATLGLKDSLKNILAISKDYINNQNNFGLKPISLSIIHGHPECFELMIKTHWTQKIVKTSTGESLTQLAIKHNQVKILSTLLENIKISSPHRFKYLELAAEHGSIDVIDFLSRATNGIPNPEYINQRYTDTNPLLITAASRKNNNQALAKLIELGADISQRSNKNHFTALKNHLTALHCAAKSGDSSMINTLVAAGLDINAKSIPDRCTPLMYAATNDLMSAQELLNHRRHLDIDAVNREGLNALGFSVMSKNFSISKLLLESGCRVNLNDANHKLSMELMSEAVSSGDLDFAEAILSRLEGTDKKKTEFKEKFLLSATIANNPQMINHLVKTHKVDKNTKNSLGETPLFAAVKERHMESILALRNLGASIWVTNHAGQSLNDYTINNNLDEIRLALYPQRRVDQTRKRKFDSNLSLYFNQTRQFTY